MNKLNVPTLVENPKHKKTSFSIGTLATSSLAVVALLGLFLTLAGYGVALSVETEFGIPHATIFKSSFDLIALSVWFITWEINNFSNIFSQMLLSSKFWIWVGCVAGLSMSFWTMKFISIIFLKWLAKSSIIRKLPQLETISGFKSFFIQTSFLGVFTAIFASLFVPLLFISGFTLLILISMISATSFTAGQAHIQQYVIKPEHCIATATRSERINLKEKTKNGTYCVEILENGRTIASGRVVFSTTELIVLYDPSTGKVSRESTVGRSIVAVSNL